MGSTRIALDTFAAQLRIFREQGKNAEHFHHLIGGAYAEYVVEQAPTAWAELEAVCDLHSVEDRSARTQEILWDRFYLPKLAREHVGRYVEFINPRMYEASSSSCVEQQAAAGLNMLLPTTAQISNLHDDRFPHDIGSDSGFYSNVFGSFGVSKIRHPFGGTS